MPGHTRRPSRPQELWTFSSQRLCLSSGAGIAGLPFGILFTSTGCLALFVFFQFLAAKLGLVSPWRDDPEIAQPIWKALLGGAMILLIGGGHLAIGSLLLWTHRVTIDRARDVVVLRTGWLGVRCRRWPLSEFREVQVVPEPDTHPSDRFRIDLAGDDSARVTVGHVTMSQALADTVASDVGTFTGLPVKRTRDLPH